jgi:hypothetical protein
MPNAVPAADTGLPNLNRRSALAKLGLGIAASTSLATIATAAPASAASSPTLADDAIFMRIDEHKRALQKSIQLYETRDEAEAAAREIHGPRPDPWFFAGPWASGGSAERAGDEWNHRAGIAPLLEQSALARRGEHAALLKLISSKPATLPGLMAYAIHLAAEDVDIDAFDIDLDGRSASVVVLNTISAALADILAGDGRMA